MQCNLREDIFHKWCATAYLHCNTVKFFFCIGVWRIFCDRTGSKVVQQGRRTQVRFLERKVSLAIQMATVFLEASLRALTRPRTFILHFTKKTQIASFNIWFQKGDWHIELSFHGWSPENRTLYPSLFLCFCLSLKVVYSFHTFLCLPCKRQMSNTRKIWNRQKIYTLILFYSFFHFPNIFTCISPPTPRTQVLIRKRTWFIFQYQWPSSFKSFYSNISNF